jgi:hypothetical protein
MIVLLNSENQPTDAVYFQHFCNPFVDDNIYGRITWSAMGSQGFLFAGSHPYVYSAQGGHASYPRNIRNEFIACSGFYDRTGEGVRWYTWNTPGSPLKNASAQRWYGFGGGWGERDSKIDLSYAWGPLGPGPQQWGLDNPPVPASFQ